MTQEGIARVLAMLVVLCACANHREELYSDELEELPFVPFLPDEERKDDCTACAKQSCTQQREACIDDRACADLLDCRGDCADPACLARCGERTSWDFDRVGFPENELFDAFERCVALANCRSECGWGQNWGCQGHYAWPDAKDATFTIELEVRGGPSLAPHVVSASACSAPGCTQPIDEAETDGWGQVSLAASMRTQPEFLRFDFGDQLMDLYSAPIFRETRIAFIAALKLYPEYVTLGGPELRPFADPKSTILWLETVDCAGARAPGVRYELEGDDQSQPFYATGLSGIPSLLATETDASGIGGFLGVAEGDVAIRVRGSDDQRLASRGVPLVAGQTTVVVLFPDTTVSE